LRIVRTPQARDSLTRLFALEQLGIKFGLDNIRSLCEGLGNPQNRFPSVIVAGTNGKGSVTAMVEHALRVSGLRTARYTSPHLVRIEERFFIHGSVAPTERVAEAADRVLATAESLRASGTLAASPTFFEATTAIAFLLFAEAPVDVAVLEVGLGGRFDATNIVTPIAAAITTIDLDHQRFLGDTLREIAFEKAGVIKPGISVVVGERKREAVEVIRGVCRERESTCIDAWAGVTVETSREAAAVTLVTERARYGPVVLGLSGSHQIGNAIVCVRLLEELERVFPSITVPAVTAGLRDVVWPGRLHSLQLGGGRSLLLDAAHNPAGARTLAAYLGRTSPDGLPIVLAAMHDKDIAGIVAALREHATAFITTRPKTPRAADPHALARLVTEAAPDTPVEVAATPIEAVERAFRHSPSICACGSIFLVGELLAAYDTRETRVTPDQQSPIPNP
jgi:dihydrofolate synthase/folylpolyglutamate synthase